MRAILAHAEFVSVKAPHCQLSRYMDCSGKVCQTDEPAQIGDRTYSSVERLCGLCQRRANQQLSKRKVNALRRKMQKTVVLRWPVVGIARDGIGTNDVQGKHVIERFGPVNNWPCLLW